MRCSGLSGSPGRSVSAAGAGRAVDLGGGSSGGGNSDFDDGNPPKKFDGDSSPSDYYSTDSDGRRRRRYRRRKGKELDKANALALPAASGWYDWKRHIKTEPRVASGRLDSKHVPYINESFAISRSKAFYKGRHGLNENHTAVFICTRHLGKQLVRIRTMATKQR